MSFSRALWCYVFFAIRAIDFAEKPTYTHANVAPYSSRCPLAVGVTLVGYNVLIIGTGLAGALALLNRYWRDFVSDPGTTQNIQWMTIIGVALMLAWRIGYMRESGRY